MLDPSVARGLEAGAFVCVFSLFFSSSSLWTLLVHLLGLCTELRFAEAPVVTGLDLRLFFCDFALAFAEASFVVTLLLDLRLDFFGQEFLLRFVPISFCTLFGLGNDLRLEDSYGRFCGFALSFAELPFCAFTGWLFSIEFRGFALWVATVFFVFIGLEGAPRLNKSVRLGFDF